MNGHGQVIGTPAAWIIAALAVIASGCQGQQSTPPSWSWAPGSGARISPPQTGRGAYGSPDPYYQSAPRGNTSLDRGSDDEAYARRGDDRQAPVSQAGFSRDRDELEFKGMPKSGEPKRFEADEGLVEMTDLPESQFGRRTPRSAATIVTSGSRTKRTPYRDYDRSYDDDYRAASRSSVDNRWRRRQ